MIAHLLGALQFLTTVPVRRMTASPGSCAAWFPLIGAAIGCLGGLLFVVLRNFVPTTIAALFVLAFWAVLTGGLHEDGLCDVADALRAGRSHEKMLAILKDSRIGAHGALALVLITLIRWQALSNNVADPVRSMAATFAVSRASLAALAWIAPPVGSGLGFEFSKSLTSTAVLLAISQAVFWACFSGAGVLLLWGAALIVIASRAYYNRRIAGVTGDCLGATCVLVETWGLVLFSCLRCM